MLLVALGKHLFCVSVKLFSQDAAIIDEYGVESFIALIAQWAECGIHQALKQAWALLASEVQHHGAKDAAP